MTTESEDDKKSYAVTVKFTGKTTFYVDAESEEDAKECVFQGAHLGFDEMDASDAEWTVLIINQEEGLGPD